MLRELAAARHTDMHHLLVLRNGQVICECNFAPYRSGIWHATYSMCKSITGMAVGFLISEGKLPWTRTSMIFLKNEMVCCRRSCARI